MHIGSAIATQISFDPLGGSTAPSSLQRRRHRDNAREVDRHLFGRAALRGYLRAQDSSTSGIPLWCKNRVWLDGVSENGHRWLGLRPFRFKNSQHLEVSEFSSLETVLGHATIE